MLCHLPGSVDIFELNHHLVFVFILVFILVLVFTVVFVFDLQMLGIRR